MRAILRDLLELAWTYVIAIIITLGWMVFGLYIYLRPTPPSSPFGTEFNHDIGTALVAQGLIVFVLYSIGGALRIGQGQREKEEAHKDRQMLREMYQWMQEQRSADTLSTPSGLPLANGNQPKPEGEVSKLH